MFLKLVLLFIGLPLVELAILVKLGTLIGFWPTIGIVAVTGFIGAGLARSQGFRVWTDVARELQAGRMPVGDLTDGLLILIGGIVLLTPGLITDLFGFAMLIPTTRRGFKRYLSARFQRMTRSGEVRIYTLLD